MTDLLFQLGVILFGLFVAGHLAPLVRLSVVPLYIVAGIFLAGYVSHSEMVEFLSLMGVLFLLFYMGLDFSFSTFLSQWRSVFAAGTIDLLINFPLGLLLGFLLEWTLIETLFLAGIMYMSSSAVVAKSLIDLKRLANPETETILGIMVYEDLVIAFYLAVLSGMALSGRVEGGAATLAIVKGVGFCSLFILTARLGKPWIERVLSQDSSELFLFLVFALVLLCSFGALAVGLSEAIGAFMLGMLLSETAQKHRVHESFLTFQQFFAALFFVSFGMQIDYRAFADVLQVGLLFFVVALIGKMTAGILAGRWQGLSTPAILNLGFALVPKGEFSIILAGVAARVARPEIHIEALVAFFVLLMSIVGPTLMKESRAITDLGIRASQWMRLRFSRSSFKEA
ncbi:MAG: cation:proton antiporter [Candidatus Binatia bacterium]